MAAVSQQALFRVILLDAVRRSEWKIKFIAAIS